MVERIKNFQLRPGALMCLNCIDTGRVPNGDQKFDLDPCPECERGEACSREAIMFIPEADVNVERFEGATFRVYLSTKVVKDYILEKLEEVKGEVT